MTGLDKIIEQIRGTAEQEATQILEAAHTEAAEIAAESAAKSKAKCDAMISSAQLAAEDMKRRVDSSIALKKRQDILAKKQQMIRETLEAAKIAVTGLPDEEYTALFAKQAKEINLQGSGLLLCNATDQKRLGKAFLKEFPQGLLVEMAEQQADILGGFLLRLGNITINCSIEALFERHRDQFAETIQKELFAG